MLKTAKLLNNFKFTMVGGSGKELLDTQKFSHNNKIKNVKICTSQPNELPTTFLDTV